MKTCCICGIGFDGWGSNPQPFSGEQCCPECDDRFVVPTRMLLGRGYNNEPILMLIQSIAELGSSIRNAHANLRREQLIPVPNESGKSNSDSPKQAG